MNTRSLSFAVIIAALSLTAFAGCYTKLMPFHEAVEKRRASIASTSGGTTTGEINYTDNCTSCHSEAELADRAPDVNAEDFYAIHGVRYDPYGWQNPYVQPPWWDPTPIHYIPVGGGSLPVITTGGGSSTPAAPAKNAKRTRESGSKRDGSRERQPVPASTTTASPAPSTPSTPSAPPPTTSTPVPTISTPPAQNNPTPSESTRTRSSGGEDTRTRKSGSGRE